MRVIVALFFLFLLCTAAPVLGQDQANQDKLSVWLPFQAIPTLTLLSSSPSSAFGFEWEGTPLLYSFGMNKQISPWYSVIVEPTARFTGSLELSISGQLWTSKVGASYFSYSGRLTGFLPLIERGEHLTLNLGVAAYRFPGRTQIFKVVGVSTIFSIVHLNVKQGNNPTTWITSLEFRVF